MAEDGREHTRLRPHSLAMMLGPRSIGGRVPDLIFLFGLGVKTRRQANRDSEQSAELSPEFSCKLGSLVRDDVAGEAMQSEYVLEQEQFSVFFGCGTFG